MCSITEIMSDQWFSTMLPILVIEHEFYLLQLFAYEFLKKKQISKENKMLMFLFTTEKMGLFLSVLNTAL